MPKLKCLTGVGFRGWPEAAFPQYGKNFIKMECTELKSAALQGDGCRKLVACYSWV